MGKKQQEDSLVLMEEFVKTAKAIGSKKTLDYLIELRKVDASPHVKSKQEIILNEVLREFNTTYRILCGVKHDGRIPRMFIYVMLKRHLSLHITELAHVFKRSETSIYGELSAFGKFDIKNQYEAAILRRFEKVENEVLRRIS